MIMIILKLIGVLAVAVIATFIIALVVIIIDDKLN